MSPGRGEGATSPQGSAGGRDHKSTPHRTPDTHTPHQRTARALPSGSPPARGLLTPCHVGLVGPLEQSPQSAGTTQTFLARGLLTWGSGDGDPSSTWRLERLVTQPGSPEKPFIGPDCPPRQPHLDDPRTAEGDLKIRSPSCDAPTTAPPAVLSHCSLRPQTTPSKPKDKASSPQASAPRPGPSSRLRLLSPRHSHERDS